MHRNYNVNNRKNTMLNIALTIIDNHKIQMEMNYGNLLNQFY